MTDEELADQREAELDALEERRECLYGGCRCCAKLVAAGDEIRRLQQERDEAISHRDDYETRYIEACIEIRKLKEKREGSQ